MKIIFFTLLAFCFSTVTYSQIDTAKIRDPQSFEDYKKSEEQKFSDFKEKRAKEIKSFISNEENWNVITVGEKGNVEKNTVQKNSVVIALDTVTKDSIIKLSKSPNYAIQDKKLEVKEGYHHPLGKNKFRLSSKFGYRIHPIYKTKRFHSGVDFSAAKGVPIYSMSNGKVIRAGKASGYGNYIIIDHGNGLKSAYAHMSEMFVIKGQTIKKGDTIGSVGMTGTATGNHLHFEVIVNNKKSDPLNYITKSQSPN